MARTALTKLTAPGAYAGAGVALAFTAADVANKNRLGLTGRELVIVRNVDGAVAHTVTFTSVDDAFNRKEDISEAIPAGDYRIYGPFTKPGWEQSDGNLYLEADAAEIEFTVIQLPS